MPELVERAERCHRAPCAVAAEARHPQFSYRGRVLRKGKQSVVEFHELQPPEIKLLPDVRFSEHGPDTHYGFVLGSLVGDVLAVGGPVNLVPPGPRGVGKPWVATYLGREYLLFRDVAVVPIHLAGEVEPALTARHRESPPGVGQDLLSLPRSLP